MTLSKPEDMDDVEQSESNESDESGDGERTVDVAWESEEMPVSGAIEGHGEMLMSLFETGETRRERIEELEAVVLEQREMLNELTAGFELLSEEMGEGEASAVRLNMDLRGRPASFEGER